MILEVETDAEFVEGFADLQHFFGVGDAVGAAEGLVFVEADVVLVVVFEGVADADPGGWPVFADLRELSEAVLDVVLEVLEFFGVAGEVEGEEFFEVSKFSSEFAFVERAFVVALFVLDDEDGAVVGEDANDVEPVVEVGVFTAIVHH